MHRVTHAIVITLGASSLACAAVLETTLDVLATTTYTFVVRSSHPNVVNFELYSTDRNVVWPGGGETYYLDDGDPIYIDIACQVGETVCYAAWVGGDEDQYWGAGPDHDENCSDCCYTCRTNRSTEEIHFTW